MSEFQEPEDIDELRPYMEDGDEDVEVVSARKTRNAQPQRVEM
jgi:hypothetical protein